MRSPNTVDREELRELLSKGWLTHDAMWFRASLEELGATVANRLNTVAVAAMSRIEARRLLRTLELESVTNMAELRCFLDGATRLIRCDFMGFEPSYPTPNSYRWDMPRCFAYDGVRRLGAIDAYDCGIFTRLEGWLQELGVTYTVAPKITGCMMHRHGHCHREYLFRFPKDSSAVRRAKDSSWPESVS